MNLRSLIIVFVGALVALSVGIVTTNIMTGQHNDAAAFSAGQSALGQNATIKVDQTVHRALFTVSDNVPTSGVGGLLGTAGGLGNGIAQPTAQQEQSAGGDRIDDGKIICSIGFNVTKNGQNYVLTAGHCTQGLPNWPGLGPSVESNFPETDFGLIRNDTNSAPGAVDLYNGALQPISGIGTAYVGEKVCVSGQTTKVTCGEVTALNQTVDYGNGDVIHGLVATNVVTDRGDSGSPVFAGSTALGTISGGNGQVDYFQPLAPELSAYGVRLITS